MQFFSSLDSCPNFNYILVTTNALIIKKYWLEKRNKNPLPCTFLFCRENESYVSIHCPASYIYEPSCLLPMLVCKMQHHILCIAYVAVKIS